MKNEKQWWMIFNVEKQYFLKVIFSCNFVLHLIHLIIIGPSSKQSRFETSIRLKKIYVKCEFHVCKKLTFSTIFCHLLWGLFKITFKTSKKKKYVISPYVILWITLFKSGGGFFSKDVLWQQTVLCIAYPHRKMLNYAFFRHYTSPDMPENSLMFMELTFSLGRDLSFNVHVLISFYFD